MLGREDCRRNPAADVTCAGAPAPPLGRARNRGPRPADGFGDCRKARPSSRRQLPRRRDGRGRGTPVQALCWQRRPAGRDRTRRRHGDAASDSQDRARGRNHWNGRRCRRRRRSGGRPGVADRIGNRSGLRHGLRPRRGRRRRALHGQEGERIDVALRIVRAAHAEIDVGHGQLGLAAGADRADHLALRDGVAASDRVGPEVHERDRVAVRRRDRQRLAADRHGSGEGDRAGDRRLHPGTARRADVDSAVLSGGVRVLPVEREERQH